MTAHELLAMTTPDVEEMPARIEALNLASFDTTATINELKDAAARREEEATAEASAESNEAKRRARRAELLRADDTHRRLCAEIAELESLRVRLDERAARLRREFRLELIRLEQKGAAL